MRTIHLRPDCRRAVLALLVGLICLPMPPVVEAELLFYDGFDYPVGEELGETVSNPPWENDKRPFTIMSGSLEYPGLTAATGNHLNTTPTAPNLDSVRTSAGVWAEQTNGTLYISLLLQLESTNGIVSTNAGTSLLTLGDTSRNTPLFGLNLLRQDSIRLGVVKYPSDTEQISSSAFFTSGPGANLSADGTMAYLIIAKYEWVEGPSNDIVTVWINPTTLGAEEPVRAQVSTGTGMDGIRGVGRMILSRGPNVKVDEVRLGQTWADVTPIPRPPYRWFLIIGMLGGGLVLAGLWITRLRQKVAERSAALQAQIRARQKVEQQRLMDQERARIAHDLHDELGADITEVGMLATRAQEDVDGVEQCRCLDRLADKSRQMVAKLEEIVWAMNPQHDTLEALMSYFSFFADRFLGLANIRLLVEASENATQVAVEARVRHQLFLVFKEALANVVKHAEASEVRLNLRVEHHVLHVSVKDNGRGLKTSGPDPGGQDGIANMRRRMQQLGGRFDVAGEDDQGTTVRFSVPLSTS